jgi:hypothetical protein
MQNCVCEGVILDCFPVKSKAGKTYHHIRVKSLIEDGEEDLCFQVEDKISVSNTPTPVQITFEVRTLFTRCNTSSYTFLPVLDINPLISIPLENRIQNKASNVVRLKDTVYEIRKQHTVRNSHSVHMELNTIGDLNDSRLPSVSIYKSPQYDWIKKWMILEVEGVVKSCWNDNYPTPNIGVYPYTVNRSVL